MSGARICVLFPHLVLGGGETAMIDVAEGLQRRFELSVCVLDRRRDATAAGLDLEPELRARFPGPRLAGSPEALQAALHDVDLLLWYGTNDWTPRALGAMARRPASVRVVHTDKTAEGPDFCARWASCIDAVTCVSPAVQRQIPRAAWIPNTASPARLTGGRQRLFPPAAEGARKTLGFLGRLLSFKNVDWLVENLEALDCNLLIQGLDSEEIGRRDLETLAERLGVADRLRFLAPSRDVGSLLRSVDALAILSRHEGFPMVAVEAGMVGTPVIATRVGALPEVFAAEMLFVELEQGRPSVDGVHAALAAASPAWGEKLHARVSTLCAQERVVSQYAALVREVLDARTAAGAR